MNTTANKLTMTRIAMVPVFMVLAYCEMTSVALVVYVLACMTDFFDGYIARHYNQISTFGKFLDPLADKMLVVAALCFLTDRNQISGWAVAVIVFREFAVLGLRIIAAEKQRVIAADIFGKLKTFSTMIGIGLMLLLPDYKLLNSICIWVILLTTVFSGVTYFLKNSDVLKD